LFAGVDLAGARLQYLDLSDNAIGPLGMTGLAPFFKSQSSFSLKVLICNNNGLGPQGAEVSLVTNFGIRPAFNFLK
jgi:Ran GTPase-activating protein 1